MNQSTAVAATAVSAVPMYVELAPAASQPVANTAGALLRDYLGILAFHFERQGTDRSASAIAAALGNLPGLLLANTAKFSQEATVMPTSAVDGLADILANEWGATVGSPDLRSFSQPMITGLGSSGFSAPASKPFDMTVIVLQRPANGAPTLGYATFSLSLRQDAAALTQPTAFLTVVCSRTTFTVVDDQLSSSQSFVDDLRRDGSIADLSTTPGYMEISLN